MSKIWKAMKFVGRMIKAIGVLSIATYIVAVGLTVVGWGFALVSGSKKK